MEDGGAAETLDEAVSGADEGSAADGDGVQAERSRHSKTINAIRVLILFSSFQKMRLLGDGFKKIRGGWDRIESKAQFG